MAIKKWFKRGSERVWGGICTFKSSEEFVDVQLYLRRWHSKLFEILRES